MRLRPFTTADEEALDGAGAAAERRERGRERGRSGIAAARLGQRRLPRRRLPPAGLPRRRDADQRHAVRRHDADGQRDRPLPVRGADEERAGALDATRARAAYGAPSSLLRNFPLEGFAFGARPPSYGRTELRADEDPTDAEGGFEVELETTGGDGVRYEYQIEGEVTDVSRQRIANRASFSVHPAAVYVGVKLPYFVDQSAGVNATLVALTPDGRLRSGHRHRRHRAARAVDQHAPRRGQRLLHLGHRGEGHRRRHVAREIGARAGDAAAAADGRRLLQAARRGEGRRGPSRGRRDRVLRARPGLHGVDALRPQPHRPGAGAQDTTRPASRRGS